LVNECDNISLTIKKGLQEMKFFHVHIDDEIRSRSTFFKSNLINPNEDDITSEALSIGAIEFDEFEYVDLAEELTEEEYKKVTKQQL